jgi:hypothetical protein
VCFDLNSSTLDHSLGLTLEILGLLFDWLFAAFCLLCGRLAGPLPMDVSF